MRHAESRLAAGDTVVAAGEARRALALDRTAEPAARTVMRALALMGDRAGALRVADELARAIADGVGAAPSPETTRLAERIREARVGRRVAAAVPAARPRPPLVGRTTELTALGAAWSRSRAGEGQVVLIEGEPGEGKSRLLDELVARARLDDATVAVARAVPADRAVAWSGLAGLLAGGLADAPGLAGTAPAALAALATLDPDLAARAGGGAAGAPRDARCRVGRRERRGRRAPVAPCPGRCPVARSPNSGAVARPRARHRAATGTARARRDAGRTRRLSV